MWICWQACAIGITDFVTMSKCNAQLREVSYRTSQREIQPEVLWSASSHPLNLYASTYLEKHRVIT